MRVISKQPSFFRFNVNSGSHHTLDYRFDIELLNISFSVVRNLELVMFGQRESILSDKHLKSASSSSHHNRDIVYTIVSTPTQGNLFKLVQTRPRRVHLQRTHTFTQVRVCVGWGWRYGVTQWKSVQTVTNLTTFYIELLFL